MRVGVVGAGIVGLATAREAARRGHQVVVFEKEPRVGAHQTGHNSGVVHAGVYYTPGSLKARLCTAGRLALHDYCRERGLPYHERGKLIVAADGTELPRLEALAARAAANGVPDTVLLEAGEIRRVEPHVAGVAALHSPATAVTDFSAVAASFAADVTDRGGEVRTGSAVIAVEPGEPVLVFTRTGAERCDRVVLCAGLQADRVAVAAGLPADPRIVPFRGAYLRVRPERAHLVRGLVYPVPDPRYPFLGVHLTRHADESVTIGPNALPALGRETYDGGVSGSDLWTTLTWPGTWRMAGRNAARGLREARRSLRTRALVGAARRFVPELRPGDVTAGWSGIRAQAVAADGTLVDDFVLTVAGGVAAVRNAPSPAATSSLAIAAELCDRAGL